MPQSKEIRWFTLNREIFSKLEPWASQVSLVIKNPPANAGDMRLRFDPWVWKIPWRRAWQPTPVFLLGESHGQRSLVGCRPQRGTESNMTEVTKRQQSRIKM